MRHRRPVLLAVLVACGALVAPAAHAADVVVGESALQSDAPQIAELGQNIPAFQGRSSGTYVLTAPITGTITSWQFMSGGIDPGHTFALRVLHPAGAGQYTATATSGTVSVNGTSGFQHDTVQGPFLSAVPIEAGDSIALQAIDADNVPIEHGLQGTDGFRDFLAPFADGDTAALSPASMGDNGQVVPIQATITPPDVPIAPTAPQNQAGPTITGTPAYGQTLTCNPGSWGGTGPIALSELWAVTTLSHRRVGNHVIPIMVTKHFGPSPTIMVDDLDPSSSSFHCDVTATNALGSATATTPTVAVKATLPVIAKRRVARSLRPIRPVISFAGKFATCTTGTWRHFPTSYRYLWFKLIPSGHQLVAPTIKRFGQTRARTALKGTPGLQIFCRVYAVNAAGRSAFSQSATVLSP